MTKICSLTGWQSQTVFPAFTDNHHFPEFVSFSSAQRYFASSEAGGVDLDRFLEWFFESDCSLKTNIMLRSSGTVFCLIYNSIVLECFPEQHWNRIYGCFYFESLLISCRKGCVLMLLPRCPYFPGSFRACGGGWRSPTRKNTARVSSVCGSKRRCWQHKCRPSPRAWPRIVHGRPSAEHLLFKTGLADCPRSSLLLSRP